MPRTIYFDYNATTSLDPAVREAMLPFLGEIWGNPSSVHHVGRRARALLDDARDRAAKVLGAKPSEIVFTSGGTESNNLAIFGTARRFKPKGRHLVTSAIEHHAVLNCFDYLEKKEGFEVSRLPVDSEGLVSPEDLKKAIRPDTILVSIMAANNEIGTIQPVAEFGSDLPGTRGGFPHRCCPMVWQGTVCQHGPVQRRLGFLLCTQIPRTEGGGAALYQVAAASRPGFVWRRT